jgi:hypothetical protein
VGLCLMSNKERGLRLEGVRDGCHVAPVSKNRPEEVVSDGTSTSLVWSWILHLFSMQIVYKAVLGYCRNPNLSNSISCATNL